MTTHENRQPQTSAEDRIRDLEARVAVLEEALRVLTHGLEDLPGAGPRSHEASGAARQAHDLLLAGPRRGSGHGQDTEDTAGQ